MFLLKGKKLPKWSEVQQAIENPKKFLQKLGKVKSNIDDGEDFSAQLRCARNILREPEITKKKAS